MTKVNIHQAKTQFSRLVDLAARGKEVVIAKAGKPVARLVSYSPKGAARRPEACVAKSVSKRTSTRRSLRLNAFAGDKSGGHKPHKKQEGRAERAPLVFNFAPSLR